MADRREDRVARGAKGPTRFGVFMAPFHPTGQSPTLALERDLELLEQMDRLGFDEAWIGEHHSGGYELIAAPDVFIAHAAARTRRIRLGTGVSSLPYHHPLHVADRMVLLDHLTRGRSMLGIGPGQLISDARMLGIQPENQRRMMEESLEAILALLAGETVTLETDWFTLEEARLQLHPYTRPRFEIAAAATVSPAAPTLVGRHGLGMLSVAATNPAGFAVLARHWEIVEEQAQASGATVDRGRWRLMCPMHLADSDADARRNVRHGLVDVFTYLSQVVPMPPIQATTSDGWVEELNAGGYTAIGTPDRAIELIERLVEQSGGFGGVLLLGADLANREATLRSFELFAERVIPHFQGQLEPPRRSHEWVMGETTEDGNTSAWVDTTQRAVARAETDYAQGGGRIGPPPIDEGGDA
jgi:limonene 1,2-monooxygenase